MAAEAASGAAGAGAEVPAPIASSPLVLVTGVSGFIGAWTAAALLQLGYRVRGTVRSVAKKPEFSSVVSNPSAFEVVEANLTDPAGWPAAVAGCDYVLHVASPFFLGEPKNAEKELYAPARDGTLNVLRAVAAATPRPKRVVVTSSVASIAYGHDPKTRDPALPCTDDTWSNPDAKEGVNHYIRSKILAERAAWDFVAALPEGERFELATVCPSTVIGPFLTKSDSGSGELVATLLGNKYPAIPDLGLPFVDIRDVVRAHVAAMTTPGAAGKRFAVNPLPMRMPQAAAHLREEFGPLGYKISSSVASKTLLWWVSIVDSKAGFAYKNSGVPAPSCDNVNAKTVLGLALHDSDADARAMFAAMGYSMLRLGFLPDKSKGKALGAALKAAAEADAAAVAAAPAATAAAAAPAAAGAGAPAADAALVTRIRSALAPFAVAQVVGGLRKADGAVFEAPAQPTYAPAAPAPAAAAPVAAAAAEAAPAAAAEVAAPAGEAPAAPAGVVAAEAAPAATPAVEAAPAAAAASTTEPAAEVAAQPAAVAEESKPAETAAALVAAAAAAAPAAEPAAVVEAAPAAAVVAEAPKAAEAVKEAEAVTAAAPAAPASAEDVKLEEVPAAAAKPVEETPAAAPKPTTETEAADAAPASSGAGAAPVAEEAAAEVAAKPVEASEAAAPAKEAAEAAAAEKKPEEAPAAAAAPAAAVATE